MKVAPEASKPLVLYVITKAAWGGAQRYVHDLIEGADAAGYRPVLAYGEPGPLAERVRALGVPVHCVRALGRDISLIGDIAACIALYRLFRELRPDIVHLNSSKAGAAGALAARLAGAPRVVFTAHGWAFTEDRGTMSKLVLGFLHYLTVLLAHETIAVSSAVAGYAKRWPFARRKVRRIRLGISAPLFRSRDEARQALIARTPGLAGAAQERWIGTIAELHPNKGLDIGIAALRQAGLKNIRWVILGDGEARARLRAQASGLRNVHFLGFVPDAAAYLPAFDLFLLPSRTESLGYVLLEAGAAGLPVLASNVGGIPEALGENGGVLFPRGDAARLSAMLAEFDRDPETFVAKGPVLAARVAKRFSLKRMREETFALYRPTGGA